MRLRRRDTLRLSLGVSSFALTAFGAAGGVRLAGAQPSGPVWLGIGLAEAPGGLPGVLVERVVPTSPAAEAGLRPGDRILRLDAAVVASPKQLTTLVRAHAAGDVCRVELLREGAPRALDVKLALQPSQEDLLRRANLGTPLKEWSSVKAVHGRTPVDAASLAGRVVVLDFWATWCEPCRLTAPVLDGWQAKYGAQGLVVVGVSTEEFDTIAAHGARSRTTYALAADVDGKLSRARGVSSLPTLFVIDRAGIVREIFVGYDPTQFQVAERAIKTLLAERRQGR